MSWFKAKIKSNLEVAKGDTIKNSQVTINSNSSDSSVIMEIYRALGRVEGQVKCMIKDINYIKSKVGDLDDRIINLENKTPAQLMKMGKLK